MPTPFNRFRLLNNGNRDVTSAKFKRYSTEATYVDTGDLVDEEDVGPVPQTTAMEYLPKKVGYYTEGVKVFAITQLVVGSGGNARSLDTWELFYEEEIYDPEANYVVAVDLFIEGVPNMNNDFYALAQLMFSDGTQSDYYSPILHA